MISEILNLKKNFGKEIRKNKNNDISCSTLKY